MSTYTDIRTRVKENIAVGSKDRITTQVARFTNEENEFWGTFKGAFAPISAILSAAILDETTVINVGGEKIGLSVVGDVKTGDAIAYVPGFRTALEQAHAILSAEQVDHEQLVDAVSALYCALTSFNFSGYPRPEPEPEPEPVPPPEPDVVFSKVVATGHEDDQGWDNKSTVSGGFSIIGSGFTGREDDLIVTVFDGGRTISEVDITDVDDSTIKCSIQDTYVGQSFVVTLGLVCVDRPLGAVNVTVVADDAEEEDPEG